MTVRDLIKMTLQTAGVLAANDTPSANDQTLVLNLLTEMLDSWSAEGFLIYAASREEFTLASGQSTRTMGPTGNFVTTRPSDIVAVNLKINNLEYPLDIINLDQWAALPDKSLTTRPSKVYIQGTFPNETLNLYPTPDAAYSLDIYSRKPLTTLLITDTLSYPPGYQEALRLNLTKKILPFFGKAMTPELDTAAFQAMAKVRRQNSDPTVMTSDVFGLSHTYSNSYVRFTKGT